MKKLTDGRNGNHKVNCIHPNSQPSMEPQPVIQMTILGFDNGKIAIQGLPLNLNDAQAMLAAANKIVMDEFIKLAKEGELDKDNTIIQSQIIQPKSGIQVVK